LATIVVVEDQADNLMLLSALLTARGHRVVPLSSGDGLTETMLAESPRPDLLLLDIELPGKDGWDLLEDLKACRGDRAWKVVALTAHTKPADRERARAAGFDGYITKPIDIRGFANEVAAYLVAAPAEPEAPR
jgi:two-component system cell cycle response regulator DivK